MGFLKTEILKSDGEKYTQWSQQILVTKSEKYFIPSPTTSLYAPIPDIVRTRNEKYNLLEYGFLKTEVLKSDGEKYTQLMNM